MKKLILCRHADALPLTGRQTDIERELSVAGITQCEQAKKWLFQHYAPQPVIACSSAIRAIETANIISGAYPGISPQIFEELYECPSDGLLEFVNNLPETSEVVLLIGHNPGLSYFASNLCHRDVNFATCQILFLDLNISKWAYVSYGTADILDEFIP